MRLNARTCPVTLAWIALCTVLYLASMVGLIDAGAFAVSRDSVASQPWTLVTNMLMHGSLAHLAMNMLTLYVIGQGLEPAIGSALTAAGLVVSGIAGAGAFLLLQPDPHTAALGASGAIFGLFGVLLALAIVRRTGDLRGPLVLVGANLAFGFLVPGVAWQAHVGGLIAGFLLGLVALPIVDRRRRAGLRRRGSGW